MMTTMVLAFNEILLSVSLAKLLAAGMRNVNFFSGRLWLESRKETTKILIH